MQGEQGASTYRKTVVSWGKVDLPGVCSRRRQEVFLPGHHVMGRKWAARSVGGHRSELLARARFDRVCVSAGLQTRAGSRRPTRRGGALGRAPEKAGSSPGVLAVAAAGAGRAPAAEALTRLLLPTPARSVHGRERAGRGGAMVLLPRGAVDAYGAWQERRSAAPVPTADRSQL